MPPPTDASWSWNAASRRAAAAARSVDDDHPAFAGQPGDGVAIDEVRPRRLAERRLDGSPQPRLDLEVVVEPATADPPRGTSDPARLLLRGAHASRLEPTA